MKRFDRLKALNYKALSNRGYSLKDRIVRLTKIVTFLVCKGNHFCVTPNDCRRQSRVFKQVNYFLSPPYLTAPPNAWYGSAATERRAYVTLQFTLNRRG